MINNSSKSNQSGFTLVEIICAVAILGILMVPTYSIFVNSAKSQVSNEVQLKANNSAQAVMEDTLSKPDISVGTTSYNYQGFITEVTIEKSSELTNDLNDGRENTLTIKTGSTPGPTTPVEDNNGTLPGPPSNYNARLEIFDYADRDFYFMQRAAHALLFKDNQNIDEMIKNFTQTGSYPSGGEYEYYKNNKLKNYKDMTNFSEAEKKDFMKRANLTQREYERAYSCFAGINQSEVISFSKDMFTRYNTVYNKVKQSFAGGSDTSAQEKIDYILNSDNIFDKISDIYDTLYNGSTKEKAFFNNIKPSWYEANLKSYMVVNTYNSMYTVKTNATTNGPILRLKLFDVNGNIVSIGGNRTVLTWYPPTGGSFGADINFQIMQDYIGFENWQMQYRWTPTNPLNIETTNLQVPWGSGKNDFYYKENIYKNMTMYITGTLEYRTVRFAMWGGSPNLESKRYYFDDEENKWKYEQYMANMNFYQTVLAKDKDMLGVEEYGDLSWITRNKVPPPDNNGPTDDNTSKDTTSTVTYRWGGENDSVYKITVRMYKSTDTQKKNPIVTLVSFKNVNTGATVEKTTEENK